MRLVKRRERGGRRVFLYWLSVSVFIAALPLAAAACAAMPAKPAPFAATLVPPPTATPPPPATPAYPHPRTPLNADDLGHLPDDPTALMLATLEHSLADVGRKMAYSGNPAYIPVLLEFMRFQSDDEALVTLASFLVRIRDGLGAGEFAIIPPGQAQWHWWQEWLGRHPEVTPPPGYAGWKGRLFSLIDPRMGQFIYHDAPAAIRLEEIVWGGVRRDGIPDLQYPPTLTPAEASYLNPDDRVFGVSINGQHRAYPLRVLNAHEMANDVLGGQQIALAY